MGDGKLDSYVSKAVQNLKNSGYKTGDVRNSFEKIVRKPFQNLFFLIIVYAACLLVGIIILGLSNLSSPLFAGGLVFYVLIVIASLLLGFVSYFCFGYFRIGKITKFILTFSLSLLLSGAVFLISNYFFNLLRSISTRLIADYSSVSVFSNILEIFDLSKIPNVWIIIVVIVVLYNLLSIIGLFRKD